MEHETYGREAANVIVDKDGRLIVDGITNGINETVQEQIREYLNLMIDGRVNNLSARLRKIGNRISVLDRLHLKQDEIAKRSGKSMRQMETGQDMERRRKKGRCLILEVR